MAKQPTSRSSEIAATGITRDRFLRLATMVQALAQGPQSREALMRKMRIDVRGFYRDLELVRGSGIAVALERQRYRLDEAASQVLERLPFPNPHLTLGEVTLLARGRTPAHRKLKRQLAELKI
jgi:hypothetical protein